VVAVAFMQSTSMDRLSSRTVANYYQAQLAAEAGSAAATALLASLLKDKPFHSVGTELDAQNNPITVFFGGEGFNEVPETFYLRSSTGPPWEIATMNDDNSLDLNAQGLLTDGQSWFGSATIKTNGEWVKIDHEARAMWINIPRNGSIPVEPDPSKPGYNPVVARYAFWIDDETARLDVGVAGNSKDGGGFSRVPEPAFALPPDGVPPADFRSGRGPSELDIGALPLENGRPLDGSRKALNERIVDFIQQNKSLPSDMRRISFVDEVDYDEIKYHTTEFAISSELAGTGRRRVNLNHLVTNTDDPNRIAADLDDIIYVITGRHVFAGSAYHSLNNASHEGVFLNQPEQEGPMPDFGKRFYTNPGLSTGATLKEDHASVYLLKLAANIRDYIDEDSQPTFVDFAGEVNFGKAATTSWLSGEEPIALGKEAIPYLLEHAWRGKLKNVEIVPDQAGAPANRRSISFTMDHYFEFYNPSTKDWTAPPNTVLKVYNLPPFDANQFPPVNLPDLDLDLSGRVFPAGTAVVVTTAPTQADDPEGLLQPNAKVERVIVPQDAREFSNIIANAKVGAEAGASARHGLRMVGRTSAATDYQTELVFSTNEGVLDAFPFLTIAGTQSPFEMTLSLNGQFGTWTLPPKQRDDMRFVWAHNLRGNDAVSRSGDPRSLSEPLQLVAGSNAQFGWDQGRFFNHYSGLSLTPLPGSTSFGSPQTGFTAPANWPDYHVALANDATKAYAIVADENMRSIGELGHIYDPHRKLDPESPRGILTARGGGRTLKIGQRDDLVDNSAARFTGASGGFVGWFNGAWRLTDLFSAESPRKPVSPLAARGKININGVLRDGGTAFRAALRGLNFNPAPLGDSSRAGMLSDADIDTIIKQVSEYISKNGPMMCRGELGLIPFFNIDGSPGGLPSNVTIDRGREEIFRRVVELITTRSLAFRVYVVGQRVAQAADGSIKPESTVYRESVVLLEPVIGDNPNDVVTGYTATNIRSMEL